MAQNRKTTWEERRKRLNPPPGIDMPSWEVHNKEIRQMNINARDIGYGGGINQFIRENKPKKRRKNKK